MTRFPLKRRKGALALAALLLISLLLAASTALGGSAEPAPISTDKLVAKATTLVPGTVDTLRRSDSDEDVLNIEILSPTGVRRYLAANTLSGEITITDTYDQRVSVHPLDAANTALQEYPGVILQFITSIIEGRLEYNFFIVNSSGWGRAVYINGITGTHIKDKDPREMDVFGYQQYMNLPVSFQRAYDIYTRLGGSNCIRYLSINTDWYSINYLVSSLNFAEHLIYYAQISALTGESTRIGYSEPYPLEFIPLLRAKEVALSAAPNGKLIEDLVFQEHGSSSSGTVLQFGVLMETDEVSSVEINMYTGEIVSIKADM